MYMTGSPSITFDMGPMLARAGIMAIFISPLVDGDFTLTGCSFEKLSFDDDCNLVTEKPSAGWSRASMTMTVITIILMDIIVSLAVSSPTLETLAMVLAVPDGGRVREMGVHSGSCKGEIRCNPVMKKKQIIWCGTNCRTATHATIHIL